MTVMARAGACAGASCAPSDSLHSALRSELHGYKTLTAASHKIFVTQAPDHQDYNAVLPNHILAGAQTSQIILHDNSVNIWPVIESYKRCDFCKLWIQYLAIWSITSEAKWHIMMPMVLSHSIKSYHSRWYKLGENVYAWCLIRVTLCIAKHHSVRGSWWGDCIALLNDKIMFSVTAHCV